MTLNYHRVWATLNDLEMVTSKISSAREILDSAINKLQEHQYDKAETLLYAVDEFLQYYLQEFDTKFKDAWGETVKKLNQEESDVLDAIKNEWEYYEPTQVHSESYYDYSRNDLGRPDPFDKVVKWRLPVEKVKDSDTDETEYFITFPDDLLKAANLSPGEEVEWVDRNDGSFLLRKVTKPLEMDEC